MALDLATFRSDFPEFSRASDTLVTSKLADALEDIDATEYGSKADQAQGYLTAHLLAMSATGRPARVEAGDGRTTYLKRFEAVRRSSVLAARVI